MLTGEQSAFGQTSRAAMTFPSGNTVIGIFGDGTGWTFVPVTDLRITGLNFGTANPFRLTNKIKIWESTNTVIANYLINYSGETNFQSIPPLVLNAGTTYGISCQLTNAFENITFRVYSRYSDDDILRFNQTPYIEQFATFIVSSNGQWSASSPVPTNNGDYFFFGPNFRFELVQPPIDAPFQITSVSSPTNHAITLQWESVTNQLYLIKRSVSASRNFATVLSSNLLAAPPLNIFTDPTATNEAAYYWVEVQP